MVKKNIIHLIWPPLLIYLLYVFSKIAWFDSLSSLANDSVHYLVMALHYSPWITESPAISTAWLNQDFPPFFPWILAFSGAAHSFLYAHILITGMGLASLYFYYLLSKRWMDNQSWIILPVIIFALSPNFLLGQQGILSEPLYILLVFTFMLIFTPEEKKSSSQILIAGVLLGAILLTRTIGIALCMGILAQAFFSSISHKKVQYYPVIITIFAFCTYFFSMAMWGPIKESHYLDILIRYITAQDLYQIGTGTEHYFSVVTQLNSLLNSWTSFWIIYWREDVFSMSYFVMMALLVFSISGLLIRLYENKYDSWYVLFYLMILLVWPHPGQMVRLLFPVMPLLLIYSGYTVLKLTSMSSNFDRRDIAISIFYLLVLATVLPSHAFIHERIRMASANQMVPVSQIFRRSDFGVAKNDLVRQNQMLKDFSAIKDFVPVDEKVMYFLPSYLAILSDRHGIAAPSPVDGRAYRQIAQEKGVSYIFLTRLHPRNTQPNYSGFTGANNLHSGTDIVWCSQLENGELASCLYKITKP